MIRSFQNDDLERVMSIWLAANIEAHHFILPSYWENHFDEVKKMIPRAEVYVSECDGAIDGFIGITRDYIAGIFVARSARGKGIGSELLRFAQKNREKLDLEVYKKNVPAVNFYRNRGFQVMAENIDAQMSETEYMMTWKKSSLPMRKDSVWI